MILIEEIEVDKNIVRFYKGVNFDKIIKHAKDGSDGFIFCFIDNWKSEVKSYNRVKKIESLIRNEIFSPFRWDSIENNYVSIYQTEGTNGETVYESIKEKVLNNRFPNMPWFPISGLSTGAWKIK